MKSYMKDGRWTKLLPGLETKTIAHFAVYFGDRLWIEAQCSSVPVQLSLDIMPMIWQRLCF